jgi:hypothetical protein
VSWRPIEGNSEKENETKILKKRIEGKGNVVELFVIIKMHNHSVIVKKDKL